MGKFAGSSAKKSFSLCNLRRDITFFKEEEKHKLKVRKPRNEDVMGGFYMRIDML